MPNARDAAEFTRMFSEKTSAFSRAWLSSWATLYWAPWRVALEVLSGRGGGGATALAPLARAWHRQGWDIAGSWLAPVHRTAVANARRLRRQ